MIKIDDSLLEELGLMALPKQEREAMLRQIYETLEMRVGMRLAERMSDQQLDEFEKFIDGDIAFTENYLTMLKPAWQQSEAYVNAVNAAQQTAQKRGVVFNENAVKSEFGALSWLETNFPDYKDVVASELEKLKGEIRQDSSKIIEAMQSAPAAAPQQPVQPQVSPPANNVVQANFGQPQPPAQPQQQHEQQPPQIPPAPAA